MFVGDSRMTTNENSLEELAWDQFIRTKVGQHDMDDLDDLNIDMDDVMMGDSPVGSATLLQSEDEDVEEEEVDDEIAALKGWPSYI